MSTVLKASADIQSARKPNASGSSPSIRWNLAVSSDTDKSLRMFLAGQGGGRKGDLSRFVEEAVRARIFEQAVEQTKTENASIPEEELTAIIDEAVQWARNAHHH